MATEDNVATLVEKSDRVIEPTIYSEIQKPPRIEDAGYFPLFAKRNPEVRFFFSYNRGNMSEARAETLEEKKETRENTSKFFQDTGLSPISESIRMIPNNTRALVVFLNDETIEIKDGDKVVNADAIFTYGEENIYVKQGDCPVIGIRAKTRDGRSIVGIVHAGAEQADAQLPLRALQTLQEHGCDMKDVEFCIIPGIEADYYTFANRDFLKQKLPHFEKWPPGLIYPEEVKDEDGNVIQTMYHVNIRGYIEYQLMLAGEKDQNIPPENGEIYIINTFTQAAPDIKKLHSYRRFRLFNDVKDERDIAAIQQTLTH